MRLRTTLLMFFFGLPLFFTSCDDEETEEEKFMKQITGEWLLSDAGVQLDNTDVNGVFDDFSLEIASDKTFATTDGNAPIWPASGSFAIQKTTTGFTLLRNDGVEVEVEEISKDELMLSFQYVAPVGARAASVGGNYRFSLVK
jgi:hypothetical protein